MRGTILASWRRSRRWHVAADRIEHATTRPTIDLDTPLTRSAQPVLRSLREQLDGQPISVILTDPTGLVLTPADRRPRPRAAPGPRPARARASATPRSSSAPTASAPRWRCGGPTHVFGHEHYAENLEDLACAGVPIHHPISGKTVGAVDLTCWRKDAGPLLLALAKTTAEQIRQALLADAGAPRARAAAGVPAHLPPHRRASCSRSNNDIVMLNDHARAVLDPADQAALLAHAAEALAGDRRGAVARRAAQRAHGADVLPPGAATGPAGRRRGRTSS